MAYKRPVGDLNKKMHPIQEEFAPFEMLSLQTDQSWINLDDLHDDARYALSSFLSMVKDAKQMDLSEYKDDVAKAKRSAPILQGRKALMTYLTKHISKAKSDVAAAANAILRVTEPETHGDATKALLAELRNQEIRGIIRATDPKHRNDLVAGNLDFIRALVNAPDQIFDKDHLTNLRRQFAFQNDPSLELMERDAQAVYRAVRKRCGEVNAISTKALIDSKMDDPLSPEEYFKVFTPKTDSERIYADKRVLSWQRQQDAAARTKAFEAKQAGVNLEIGARAERRLRQ
ncbi:MAG: hypothetical protein M0Q01_04540 [Syntrophales bacterium]|jgi:hypothetical protein|nr:hypothetical protein [Syntrophales bacterium]